MSKLNLDEKKEKLEVTINGKVYPMTYPTWGELEEAQAKGESPDGSKASEELLVTCGLPLDVIKTLQLVQLKALYEELGGLKKS